MNETPLASAVGEFDDACHFGEERVILTAAYIVAREETSATLAHQNRTATDELATEALYPEPLRVGIAPVPAAA
jgi:hypothetical protein